MRAALTAFFLLLFPVMVTGRDFARLDSLLKRFYVVLAPETPEVKTEEFNALISGIADTSVRREVALAVFDHYRDDPPVMGEEEVAVNIYDRWFADGTIPMRSEFDRMDAELFVDFNRSTLIGCKAPVLTLKTPCGRSEVLPSEGRSSILFFYDTSCQKCRTYADLLPKVLDDVGFSLDFHAVYCGRERRKWRAFRRSFRTDNRNVVIHHLWDPEMESDYLRQYGVISTPRIYMVEPTGLIVGRRLEPDSIISLLPLLKTIQNAYEKTERN